MAASSTTASPAINGSRVTGNTAPTDSAGDQGIGGGIASINLAPVNPAAVSGGILSSTFSQISRNTASGRAAGSSRPPLPGTARARRATDFEVQPGNPQ